MHAIATRSEHLESDAATALLEGFHCKYATRLRSPHPPGTICCTVGVCLIASRAVERSSLGEPDYLEDCCMNNGYN